MQLKNGLPYIPGTDERYYGIQQLTQGEGPKKSNYESRAEPIGHKGTDWLKVAVAANGVIQMATEISVHGPKPRYLGPGEWASRVKAGSKFGTRLGVLGVAITLTDASIKGKWENHHSADVAIGTLLTVGSIIPGINVGVAVVGGAYFVGDLAWQAATGKGITESIFDP